MLSGLADAHLYLLRRILHDFYDPACIDIVKNIASAMGPTSRLLVGDCVVPEKASMGDDFCGFGPGLWGIGAITDNSVH